MIGSTARLFLAAAPLALSACAASNDYPSLSLPASARIIANPPPKPTTPPPILSADLAGQLAAIVERARASHRRFTARHASAERSVASAAGSPRGGESWAVANIALSDLQAARSETLVALGELDMLSADVKVAAFASGNQANVDAADSAMREVSTLTDQEDTVIAGLRRRLGA